MAGKLDEQLQVSKRQEYKVGKTTQQIGAKPTIATQQRQEEYQQALAQRSQSLASLSEPTAEQKELQERISNIDERIEVLKKQADTLQGASNFQSVKTQFNRVVNEIQSLRKAKSDYQALYQQGYSVSQAQNIISQQSSLRDIQIAQQQTSSLSLAPKQTSSNVIVGYDDLGQPMSIAPELIPKEPQTQSKDFFDIIRPDVPDIFQSKPDISYPVSSSDLGKPPTRDELFQEGGGYFLTGKEVSNLGIETKTTLGTPTASQKLISFSEELVGGKDYIGKSGASYFEVQESKGLRGTLKSSDAYYTKLKSDFSEKYPKITKLYLRNKEITEEIERTTQTGYVPITPAITSIPNVKFLGIQQELNGGKALTSVRFIETSSNKKGLAFSLSESNLIQDSTLTATRTRGFTLRVGVKQSGEFTLKTPDVFSASQRSVSKTGETITRINKFKGFNLLEEGEVTGEKALGVVRTKKGSKIIEDVFRGAAQSKKEDSIDFVKAVSFGEKSKLGFSSGKIISNKQPSFLDSGSGSVLKTQNIGKKSLSDTKQVIEKALTTKSTIKPLSTSTLASSQIIKQKPITKQTTTTKTKTPQFKPLKTKQKSVTTQVNLPRQQTKLKTTPKLRTRQIQTSFAIQKPVAKYGIRQQPKYIQRQAPKLIQRPMQTSIYGRGTSFTTNNFKGISTPSYFNIPSLRTRATPIKRSSRGRGFTIKRKPSLVAVGMNITAPRIRGRETAFSIRPIITKKKKKKRGLLQL